MSPLRTALQHDRRDQFLARIVDRLGSHPSDFEAAFGETAPPDRDRRRAAGVLVPLLDRGAEAGGAEFADAFRFLLIKRSPQVSQPGDLAFPGGMLHPFVDRLLGALLPYAPFPLFRGQARLHAASRGRGSRALITRFFANALRESWEEIRLPPSRVTFLGPLPCYRLTRFRRTIFPVAGFVGNPGGLRPNREVERIVEIPLTAFYQPERIGCYQLIAGAGDQPLPLRYPCLIHDGPDGRREILWGATFAIIVQFLTIVLDYRLPAWEGGIVIEKTLPRGYASGRDAAPRRPS